MDPYEIPMDSFGFFTDFLRILMGFLWIPLDPLWNSYEFLSSPIYLPREGELVIHLFACCDKALNSWIPIDSNGFLWGHPLVSFFVFRPVLFGVTVGIDIVVCLID